MRRVCVNVKNGGLGGAAYNGVPDISNAPRSARYLVTLRLGRGRERWPLGPVNYHFKAPGETGPHWAGAGVHGMSTCCWAGLARKNQAS